MPRIKAMANGKWDLSHFTKIELRRIGSYYVTLYAYMRHFPGKRTTNICKTDLPTLFAGFFHFAFVRFRCQLLTISYWKWNKGVFEVHGIGMLVYRLLRAFGFFDWRTIQRTYWSVNYNFCWCRSFFSQSIVYECVCVLYSSIIHPYWISHFEVLLIRRTMQTMHSSRTMNTPSERERACVCVMPLFELRTKNIVWPFFCSIGRYIHWLNKYRPHCDRWRYRRKYTTHRTESLHHSLVWIYLYLYTFYLECGYFWTC